MPTQENEDAIDGRNADTQARKEENKLAEALKYGGGGARAIAHQGDTRELRLQSAAEQV